MNDRLTPGWRARIGIIYMHSSIVMEPEFATMAPEGVTVHTTRIVLPQVVNASGLISMTESKEVEQATDLLSSAPLSAIIFGGTSASFIKGLNWDKAIIKRMEKFSEGIPVTTTSTASVNALKSFGIKHLAIATPYIDEVNQRAHNFFSENGFDVVDVKGLGIDNDHAIGYTSLDTVYRLVKKLDLKKADGVFISCTNLQTIGILDLLEKDVHLPVVSAIQASFWECLRLAGIGDVEIAGFGSLLQKHGV